MSVETDIQALKEEFKQFKQETLSEFHELRKQASSRRGPEGGRGPQGASGRDAVVKIVQANGKVLIVDIDGKVHAELVPVPGKDGIDGVTTNLETIAKLVRNEFKAWMSRL